MSNTGGKHGLEQQVFATGQWHPHDCACNSCCRRFNAGQHRMGSSMNARSLEELCFSDTTAGYQSSQSDDSIGALEDEMWRNNKVYYSTRWSNRPPPHQQQHLLSPLVARRQGFLQETRIRFNGLFSRSPSPSSHSPMPDWDLTRRLSCGSRKTSLTQVNGGTEMNEIIRNHNGFVNHNGCNVNYNGIVNHSENNGVGDLIIVDSDEDTTND